jgi:hypothetical protein
MNASQHKFIIELAATKGVSIRATFSYDYEITNADGSTYNAPYYDCLKHLGYFGTVN